MALARRVHPGARICIPDTLSREVRACVTLYRDRLDPVAVQDAALETLEELIVVDTADRTRLGLLARRALHVPVVVYDHHPPPASEDALPLGRGISERVGATVTLLARELQRRGDPLPADLASLALLGLHEDTGGFRYDLTTPEDHEAAAWLMRRGGTLALVRRFTRSVRSEAHVAFRDAVLEHADLREVAERPVVVASLDWPTYLADVASVTADLLDAHPADAAVLVVRMGDRTLTFARATGSRFDVAAALREAVGGGGHPGAAFARSRDARADVEARVLAALARHARPARHARDVMSTPVRTVPPDATVHEASEVLLRYGHGGLPVVTPGTGVVEGVVSRRDLERALHHGLGRSPVSGFMGRPAITAPVDATLDALEAIALRNGVGRLPIVEGDMLVGIVTRSDLLAARHQEARPPTGEDAGGLVGGLEGGLEGALQRVLARIEAQAGGSVQRLVEALPSGASLYLVGGSVRDALLGASLNDLDLVVEGAAASVLVQALASEGERNVQHDAFGTASVSLPGGLRIDVATAREERYDAPGALPRVESSDVRRDLARRDFTVNAMAVRLAPLPPELLDPFGGAADLSRSVLRTLHPLSFSEDATRIVRGARLAARLGFTFTSDAVEQVQRALREGHAVAVSAERLRSELRLTLEDAEPHRAFAVLHEMGALEALYGLAFPEGLLEGLDALRREGREVPGTAYLLAMLLPLDAEDVSAFVARFHLPLRRAQVTANLRRLLAGEEPGDEVLTSLGRAGRAVLEASGEPHQSRVRAFESLSGRRRLRGRDLLELGLAPGPRVGRILEEVARARLDGRVRSFEEERAMAAERIAADGAAERQDEPQ